MTPLAAEPPLRNGMSVSRAVAMKGTEALGGRCKRAVRAGDRCASEVRPYNGSYGRNGVKRMNE
jgi:hypothetical protein